MWTQRLLLVICGLVLISGLVSNETTPTSVRRQNYGVVFQHQGKTHANSGFWTHTFHTRLPTVPSSEEETDWCNLPSFKRICTEFPALVNITWSFHSNSRQQLSRTLSKAYNMLPQSVLPANFTKVKRSLMPFIGQLSRSLFGTATEEDLQIVVAHMQAISKSQSALLSGFQRHTETMSSFVSLTQDRINNLDQIMKIQYETIVKSIKADHEWVQQHGTNLNVLMYEMFTSVFDLVPLQNQVQQLANAIEHLVAGFLPVSFITPSQLRETITDIEETLLERHDGIRVLQQDPAFYYNQHDFLYLRNDSDLYITLKFPMTDRQPIMLNAYNVIIFPVHFFNTSSYSTILQTDIQTFFISNQANYFAESSRAFSSLDRNSVDVVVERSNPSCLLAMFQDQTQNIKSLCQFQVIPSEQIKTDLYILDYPQILIRNAPSLRVACPFPVKAPKECSYCFYQVPCACSVQTPRAYLPPRISQCNFVDPLPITNLTKFPVNLALLHHFFSNDTLSAFAGNTLLNQSLTVKLPPMNFYNHSFEEKLATDQKLTYQLDKVVNATKEEQKIFRSIMDPVLAGDLSIPSDFFFTTPGYITMANLVGTTANLFVTAYLGYRMRMHHAALAVLQQLLPRAHAFTLPDFIATMPTSTTIKPLFTITTNKDPAAWGGYLILIVLILYIIKKICNCRKPKFNGSPDFDICFEVKLQGRCFFVTLQTVPGCPSDYITTGSVLCSHVTVSGWFNPQLNVVWGDFNMVNRLTSRPIYLASHFKLSWWQRFRLRNVFNDHYALLLFLFHANKGMYVAI